MKLHDVTRAPNPRRVRIFLAEKEMTDQVELVQVDMMAGDHKKPDFLQLNSRRPVFSHVG